MSLILPTEDGSEGTWDTLLNTVFGLIDAHDHTTGKGVKVPSAGLNINADVSWASGGTNYALTDALAIDFAPQAAASLASYASALFVNSDDANNLYFRNQSGTNVKITDGSTLNVSITGGIGGDYSTISALVDYDDATDTYRFRQETSASVRQYAKVATADLILREYIAAGGATVPTNAVTLKSPASLAAAYAVTWPDAVPAAQKIIQMDTSGNLVASNILATDQNIQLQGTAYVQRGSQPEVMPFLPGAAWYVSTGSPPAYPAAGSVPDRVTVPVSSSVFFPLSVGASNKRIQSITIYGRSLTDTSTLSIYVTDGIGTATLSTDAQTLSGGTTATTLDVAADGTWDAWTLTLNTPAALHAGGNIVWLRVDTTATGTFAAVSYSINADVP